MIKTSSRSGSKVTRKTISSSICEYASQSVKYDQKIQIKLGESIHQDHFGPIRRLYSTITTIRDTTDKNMIIPTSIDHKAKISSIYKTDENLLRINSSDFKSTNWQGDEVELYQTATFDIETGRIELSLKQKKGGKFWYKSQYKLKDMYTTTACIILDPYTTDNKLVLPRRIKTVKQKLGKNKTVNIYAYLNENKPYTTQNVSMSSSLQDLVKVLKIIREDIDRLKRHRTMDKTEELRIAQFEYVEEILSSTETLSSYKKKLIEWYENYKKWSSKSVETIEKHDYKFEYVDTGKRRLPGYLIHLFDRVMDYDSRIVYREDTEEVQDFHKNTADYIAESKRIDRANVQRITRKLGKARSINNVVEISRYEEELTKAEESARRTDKERRTETRKLYVVDSEFGVCPPYLVSDILRYFNSSFVKDAVDMLGVNQHNIEEFSSFINNFKSLVFNIVSLQNQLGGELNSLVCTNNPEIIIPVTYSTLYSKLKWCSKELGYTIPIDIENQIIFKPCETVIKSFTILANPATDISKIKQFNLLDVDEPLYGNESKTSTVNDQITPYDILDFDLLYSNKYNSTPSTDMTISDNMETFMEYKYGSGYNDKYENDEEELDDESAAKPSGEPVDESAAKPSGEPISESAAKPSGEPVDESAAKPSGEPISESAAKPSGEPISESAAKSFVEILSKPSIKPVIELDDKPSVEVAAKPSVEPVTRIEIKPITRIETETKNDTTESQPVEDIWTTIVKKIRVPKPKPEPVLPSNLKPIEPINNPAISMPIISDTETEIIHRVLPLAKESVKSEGKIKRPLIVSMGDAEVEKFPIEYITKDGKVRLKDGFDHYYTTGNTIVIRDLIGLNIRELEEDVNLNGKNPTEVFESNEKLIRSLNYSNWKIRVEEGKTKYFFLEGFSKQGFPVPYIKRGIVHEIFDDLKDTGKEHRDTSRDLRDKHEESTRQFTERRKKLESLSYIKSLGFTNMESYIEAKENVKIESIVQKVWMLLVQVKSLKSRIRSDSIKEEDIKAKIINLRKTNKGVFELLTIDELVKILIFYINNPENKENIKDLFKNLYAIGLSSESTVPLDQREINVKKGTTNGTMELGVEEWENGLLGVVDDKSSKKGKDKGKDKGKHKGKDNYYHEKYLSYKTKYLALKTKLGL